MANIKINGIVIAENNMGDYDKMLTVLTPNFGKISCVAKGARRPQSALLAGTQLFCFGEYMMYKGTNTYHINSCETIEIFYNIRTDLDKLKYAIHINKIIQDITEENENCYRILQLYLNTLYTISETDNSFSIHKGSAFISRTASSLVPSISYKSSPWLLQNASSIWHTLSSTEELQVTVCKIFSTWGCPYPRFSTHKINFCRKSPTTSCFRSSLIRSVINEESRRMFIPSSLSVRSEFITTTEP